MTTLGRPRAAEPGIADGTRRLTIAAILFPAMAVVALVTIGPTAGVLIVVTPSAASALRRTKADAATVLVFFAGILFLVPARQIVEPIGSVGTPAMLIALVLGTLWVHGQLLPDQEMSPEPTPVRWLSLGFMATGLAAFVAASIRATDGVERTAADRGAIAIAAATGLTMFVADSIRQRDRLRLVMEAVVLGGALCALIGIIQFTTGFDLAARIRVPGLVTQHADTTFIADRSGFRRVAGTALHAIEFGVLLVMVLPLALHLSRFGPPQRLRFHRAALVLIGLAIPMSISRTAVLGLVAAMLIIAPSWERAFRYKALVVGGVFLVFVRVAFPGLLGTLRSLFTSVFVDPSVNDRRSDYGFIADFIAERPIFGRGFFTFLPEKYDFIDNQFLMSFVETGILGLLAYLALILGPIVFLVGLGRRAFREGRPAGEAMAARDFAFSLAGAIAVVPTASASFDFLSFPTARVLAFVLLGAAGAYWRIERRAQSRYPDFVFVPRERRWLPAVPAPPVARQRPPSRPVEEEPFDPDHEDRDLAGVGSGLRWSLINQLLVRVGTFASGIVLARLLLEEDFGVYAIGFTVVRLLISINDLGLILGVVRYRGDPREAARTAWTMTTMSSVTLYVGAFLSAPLLADLVDAPEASGVIRLMALVAIIDGLAAVPSALLARRFRQGRQAAAELLGLATTVTLSVSLAAAGYGAWSLAWGQVGGNLTTLLVLFVVAGRLPRPGYDPAVARDLTRFGLPLAFGTLVEQGVLNADYLIIGALLGTEPLGVYLLAFNISSWPISVITFGVRRVSIVAFSKLTEQRDRLVESFLHTFGVLLGLGAFVAGMVAVLAGPLVDFVYGSRWEAAVIPLRVLALVGLGRMAVMFFFDLLIGDGRSPTVLRLQGIWLAILVPALWLGAEVDGTRGVAVGHLVVTAAIMVPLFVLALARSGVPIGRLAAVAARPLASMIPTALVAAGAASLSGIPLVQLMLGGLTGGIVFAGTWVPGNKSLRWLRDERPSLLGATP